MAHDPQPSSSFFTHIDVSTATATAQHRKGEAASHEAVALLRQLVAAQDRQNELLEEMVQQMSNAQKQRAAELGQWKQANPELARRCRRAAETLGQVQTQFLEKLTVDIQENEDCLLDGEFMLHEFVDRFGPRLAHLNGVLQVLSQLSSVPPATQDLGK